MAALKSPCDDPLARWFEICQNIDYYNKYSQHLDQNDFETSLVKSCLDRLNRGRELSPAQQDVILKMYRRKGPVRFCGHRNR